MATEFFPGRSNREAYFEVWLGRDCPYKTLADLYDDPKCIKHIRQVPSDQPLVKKLKAGKAEVVLIYRDKRWDPREECPPGYRVFAHEDFPSITIGHLLSLVPATEKGQVFIGALNPMLLVMSIRNKVDNTDLTAL